VSITGGWVLGVYLGGAEDHRPRGGALEMNTGNDGELYLGR